MEAGRTPAPTWGGRGSALCAPPSGESAQSGAMLRSSRRRHPTRLTPLSPTLAHLCAEQGVQDTAGIAAIDTTFLGTAAPFPPRAMMAPGEPAVDRASRGAGATGGTTTSLFSSLFSFSTSLHHDSPGAPRRRSGSIPALRLNCGCWLMRQGDGPVLSWLDQDLVDDRRAERRRAAWLGLPFWRFRAACRGGACDELEVGHQVSSPRGLREAEDMCQPVV